MIGPCGERRRVRLTGSPPLTSICSARLCSSTHWPRYKTQLLVAGDHLLGYFVAMMGVDEVHLLNITVAPAYQMQGWARVLLDALALWARGRGAQWLWLEVRVSNERALHVYQAHGFRRVGERKRYYPAPAGQREDAVVMSLPL